jgi:4-hydroxybenzoate polyprenyltransferase
VIAYVAILLIPAVMIILIVWFISIERRKRHQLQTEIYTKALEKEQPMPTDLFAEPKKKRKPLNIGIICIAVGISMGLALNKDAASLGFIPFFIGVAYVIIHFIEKKKAVGDKAQ